MRIVVTHPVVPRAGVQTGPHHVTPPIQPMLADARPDLLAVVS